MEAKARHRHRPPTGEPLPLLCHHLPFLADLWPRALCWDLSEPRLTYLPVEVWHGLQDSWCSSVARQCCHSEPSMRWPGPSWSGASQALPGCGRQAQAPSQVLSQPSPEAQAGPGSCSEKGPRQKEGGAEVERIQGATFCPSHPGVSPNQEASPWQPCWPPHLGAKPRQQGEWRSGPPGLAAVLSTRLSGGRVPSPLAICQTCLDRVASNRDLIGTPSKPAGGTDTHPPKLPAPPCFTTRRFWYPLPQQDRLPWRGGQIIISTN